MSRQCLSALVFSFLSVLSCPGADIPKLVEAPNLVDNVDRPLRYRPEGLDFVIENGAEFFNRPLYGGNTAFRVDGGDRPEFVLYLPGRGGNLRLGVRTPSGTKWLQNAASVITRYRPGSLVYEIRDPLLGADGLLQVDAIALHRSEGLIVRVESRQVPEGAELVWAFGGVTGLRGKRDGDIGTEEVPIGEYFQLKPEFCEANTFAIQGAAFTLDSKAARIAGVVSAGGKLALAEASKWSDPAALLASAGAPATLPVVSGFSSLADGTPVFLALQRAPKQTDDRGELATYLDVRSEKPAAAPGAAGVLQPLTARDLPAAFAEAEAHFRSLREHVAVETPDPFLNAAVASLNVAADAVWDEPQGVVMHGAIAWRSKLLGWRGPYVMDALGWHDRARRHLTYWSGRQNTSPVPGRIPPADEKSNLARSEAGLHSNGDLSNSHYDMNLVYIDALFRHLLWTGDLDFARQVWPVIERHLAWERRLFRREYLNTDGEKLPLYEAYAAIWASDDLQYHGGGTAHASAYNYYHNRMAARVARLLGHDSGPYEREAELIAQGMRELLWMPDRGMFAEYKDYLGLQRIHPSAALWTFYHTIDSEVPNPDEARQMTGYVDRRMPHIPVRGPGVPEGLHVLSTTDWMPYTWSINNVVMGEIIHTALGYWQAGRSDEAYRLTKSALTASMFMGISPGNVGSMNYLDVYRRESQRDFGDGSGVTSRAIIEGLFGIKPDLLAGEVVVAPGFPSEWKQASLRHPDVELAYSREGNRESYTIAPRFAKPAKVILRIPALGEAADVTVNGRPARTRFLELPSPRFEIVCEPAPLLEIVVAWSGVPRRVVHLGDHIVPDDNVREYLAGMLAVDWKKPVVDASRLEPVDLSRFFNDSVTRIFKNEYRTPRSPFVSLAIPKQGIGAWAGLVNVTAEIDDTGLRAVARANNGCLVLPNGVPFATPAEGRNIVFTSQWDNYPCEVVVPLSGRASRVFLLMAGSTNWMQSRIDNGEVIATYADGSVSRLALENPTTWWPIDQDYFIDDYQFRDLAPLPPRVDLKTGRVRLLDKPSFKGKGREVPGGAATVLALELDPRKELRSLTVRALSNEVVIGLMAATLEQ